MCMYCVILIHIFLFVTETNITLPQFTPPGCVKLRLGQLYRKQLIYRFTTPPPSPPTGEITPANFIQFLKCPVINLTLHEIAGLAVRNPHESKWIQAYFELNSILQNFVIHVQKSGMFNDLEKFSDYAKIIDAFQERIVSCDIMLVISRVSLGRARVPVLLYFI